MKTEIHFYGTQAEVAMIAESAAEAAMFLKLALNAKKTGTEVYTHATGDNRIICCVVLPLREFRTNHVGNS